MYLQYFFSAKTKVFHLIVQLDKLESIYNCIKTAWHAKMLSLGGTQYSCLVHLLEMISIIFLLSAISLLTRVVVIYNIAYISYTHIKEKSAV